MIEAWKVARAAWGLGAMVAHDGVRYLVGVRAEAGPFYLGEGSSWQEAFDAANRYLHTNKNKYGQ